MGNLYNYQTNAFCIVLMSGMLLYHFLRRQNLSMLEIVFRYLLVFTIAVSAFDIMSVVFIGKTFNGAKVLNYVGNIMYFESVVCSGAAITLFLFLKLGLISARERGRFYVLAIPLLAYTIIAFTNDFTGVLFTIDSNNIYNRGHLIILHWISFGIYAATDIFHLLLGIIKTKDRKKKKEYFGLGFFALCPIILGLLQCFFYGTSLLQVGLCISIIAYSVKIEDDLITVDPLTLMNNKRSLSRYIEGKFKDDGVSIVQVCYIDIANFKMINKKYSHLSGDFVLKKVAEIIKHACSGKDDVFISYFGNDEYVLVYFGSDDETLNRLMDSINEQVNELTNSEEWYIKFSLCYGKAKELCRTSRDLRNLVKKAQESMLENKRKSTTRFEYVSEFVKR